MHWLILCNDCAEGIDPNEIAGIFEAKFGPHEEWVDMNGSLLVCADWSDRGDAPVMQFFCEECGQPVAVAESSQWFIDEHRKERDLF